MIASRRLILAAALTALCPVSAIAQPAPDAPQKVDILLDWKALPTFAGFYLAREMGAFERRGLEVTFSETQGAISSAEMIGVGKPYWIGSSSGIATAIGRSRGQSIKSLAVYYAKTPTVIYTRGEDRIAHPRDLYGKTLGLVPGSITNEEFRALIAANRLDRSKIKETTVSWNAYDLIEKKVDALIDYDEMAPAELIAEGRRITMIRLSDFGVKAYSLNLIVNDDAWADPVRREIAKNVQEAVQEGYNMVRERPADAASHFSRLFPRLAPRYVDRSMATVSQQLSGPPTGQQTRAGWEATISTLDALGLLAKPVTVDDVAILD
ncbi:ABC transporter substrate-binding protein [Reyranella sp.]|uniref:ABC transporter substrate-binding protein n=1 Tax=Reyranella sp. TaxID=1929291 RepID=UPI0025E163A2|nr:ABC transporter substrate-binding protein [Reyranella sp.]